MAEKNQMIKKSLVAKKNRIKIILLLSGLVIIVSLVVFLVKINSTGTHMISTCHALECSRDVPRQIEVYDGVTSEAECGAIGGYYHSEYLGHWGKGPDIVYCSVEPL